MQSEKEYRASAMDPVDHYFRGVDLDTDVEEALEACGDLSYRPHKQYPRKGCVTEAAFAAVFERAHTMSPVKNLLLYEMSGPLRILPTQELATWCATVFCWLGTNCGQSVAAGEYGDSVYHSWCEDNVCQFGYNSGLGTSDILAQRVGVELTLTMWRMTNQMMHWFDTHRQMLDIATHRAERAARAQDRRRINHHAWKHGFRRIRLHE